MPRRPDYIFIRFSAACGSIWTVTAYAPVAQDKTEEKSLGVVMHSIAKITPDRPFAPQCMAVIGAGAIGCIVADAACAAGHTVRLCAHSSIPFVTIEYDRAIHRSPVEIVSDPAVVNPVDWVFIATKTQDTAGTAPWLKRLIGPQTALVVLQNGIDGADIARSLVSCPVLPSIVYIAAERPAPGRILHHFGNRIEVPAGPLADRLAVLLRGHIEVSPQPDFITAAWRKLICNIVLNPITALTMQRFCVFSQPRILDLSLGLIREAVAVGNAAGACLNATELADGIAYYSRLSPQGGTSMLYDRINGKKMEYEHLTGTILRLARKYSIPVPLNTAIFALLSAIDQSMISKGGSLAVAAE